MKHSTRSAFVLVSFLTSVFRCSRQPAAKPSDVNLPGSAANDPCGWARAGMSVTFRAEVMPGQDASQRTFCVARVLSNCRVLLEGIGGEHTQRVFEPPRD